ncbi:MAG TPA: hypothetical protein VGQ42_04650 [Candidatus Dormibacteraeota bacterium]|jgi:septal ring factor EnvC (AmiA/AmiB activator)|nr:hypothetical protein [Candidatus Dormibacteraeota bacterium]
MAKNTSTRAAIRAALEEVPEDFYTADGLLTEKVRNPLTPLRFVAVADEERPPGPYDEFEMEELPDVLELQAHTASAAPAVEIAPDQAVVHAVTHDQPVAEFEPAPLDTEELVDTEELAAETQPRRGWFGRSRRQSDVSTPAAAPAPAPASQPAVVHDDVYASALERDEARRRFAALEADLVSVQEARGHAETAAAQLNTRIDTLRDELDATRADLLTERQARAAAESAAQDSEHELATLRTAHDAVNAEHDEVIAAYAQLDEQRRTERDALTKWESHARELTDTLEREREEFLRTLEDERHTAEQARATLAFQHREQLETHAAHAATTVAGIEKQLADTQAALEATNAELGATRAEVARVTEDLQAARGEAEAANSRAREEGELRVRAEQRLEEVQEELAYVRTEVMGGRNDKNRKGGLLRRGGKPSPLKSLEPQSRPIAQAQPRNAAPAAPASEELDEILERRLFGGDA